MSNVFGRPLAIYVVTWTMSDDAASSVDQQEIVLGVENSARGKKWVFRQNDEARVAEYIENSNIDLISARILAGREVSASDMTRFFDPKLKNYMPDPSTLKDLDKGVDVLLNALAENKSIAVFADYDVDGATSAAQIIRWGRDLGHEFGLYVPDRIREGYGPSEKAFETLKSKGFDVVITVDCGAAAHSALHKAVDLGLEIIVVDHHLMDMDMPPCSALINPNRPDDSSDLGHLAAAGVTFMFLAGLNRGLKRRGHDFVPNILNNLDLTALGTICDVVALTGLNRAIVRQGLRVASENPKQGLKALGEVAQIKPPISEYHVGFVLGPRINAGGRIGQADMGSRLLSTDDAETALTYASELDVVNQDRKLLQTQIQDEVEKSIASSLSSMSENIIIQSMEGWHPGIIGIVAGRMKDKTDLPVIIIGVDSDGIGKGSGRSIPGVNLGEAIKKAKDKGLLISGGGHAMAAGLTIKDDKISEFRTFMQDELSGEIKEARKSISLKVDSLVRPTAIGVKLYETIKQIGPFGAGNPVPVFVIEDLKVAYAQSLRGGHVRCTLRDVEGQKVDAICFGAEDSGIANILMDQSNPSIHVLGRLQKDNWQGREQYKFQILDVALSKKI